MRFRLLQGGGGSREEDHIVVVEGHLEILQALADDL